MRRLLLASFLVVLAACGSSNPTGVLPPPSSPSATPAAIAVSAGNGQQAEPGAAVAVKPAVLVTDASGLPVSGATVTFAVDSGGGSLSATSAVTGSNGIATAGTWTLGSAEGRNILRVTVGSLAVLRIAATAAIVGASFPSFSSPAQTFWSQTTPDLTAGTMASFWYNKTAIMLGLNAIPSQVSPVLTLAGSFTRNGNQLTGTIALALFLRDINSAPYTIVNKQYQITATRLQ